MSEQDPNGIKPHEPGAKLDAGKMLPWLCISGFARALAAMEIAATRKPRSPIPRRPTALSC